MPRPVKPRRNSLPEWRLSSKPQCWRRDQTQSPRFFAEPMQSGGGAIRPPKGNWHAMQTMIRKYDIHFHVDETVCGFGRTGHYWGVEAFDLTPDSTTCAKALTAAFFPISAIMFRQDFFDDLMLTSDASGVLGHGFTYAGHLVGAAVALEALKIYGDIDLIGHVRGIGLFCGIQLVQGKGTRALWDPALKVGTMVQDRAHTRGCTYGPSRPIGLVFCRR
ncbi:aminotransferase class III-fold pyridoxal phosphate-dependent enzyme [Ruegeria sp. HKCCA4812]|uniref:aminotransferase class III-fold pyridoxal phosphate-dependent enzyme n=1 Tax=Ruegeria sp. HKCCA4812 TaxID=2682993 RepID=UPI003530144F